MRNVLIFFVLIVFVICPNPQFPFERRIKKIKEFQQQLFNCIINNKNINTDLKKKLQDNKEKDLKKIIKSFFTKLDSNDREIIIQCRREILSKLSKSFKGILQNKFNYTSQHVL